MEIDPVLMSAIVSGFVGIAGGWIGSRGSIQVQKLESERKERSARRARLVKAYSSMCARFHEFVVEQTEFHLSKRFNRPTNIENWSKAQLLLDQAIWQTILVETNTQLRGKIRVWGSKHFQISLDESIPRDDSGKALGAQIRSLNNELFTIIEEFQRVHMG